MWLGQLTYIHTCLSTVMGLFLYGQRIVKGAKIKLFILIGGKMKKNRDKKKDKE